MRQRERKEKGHLVVLLAMILAAFLLRVHELANHSFWYDELATWNRAVIPFEAMIDDLLLVRNHVPLYFLVMRLWALIGSGEFVLRYFSVIMGTISVPLIYQLGREIGGRKVGLLAALLLAISPFHIWYSQEARMYSLTGALILLAAYFFIRLLREDNWRYWIGYALAMVLAVYSHYLALFILAAHYAFLALHYRRLKEFFRRWIVAAAVVGVIFAVWGGYLMLTGGFGEAPISWIPAARLIEPLFTLLALSAGSTINPNSPVPYTLLAGFLVAAAVVYRRYAWRLPAEPVERKALLQALYARILVFWLLVPLALIWLISLDLPVPGKRSIYVDRYMLTALPALLLLASWGLATLTERPSRHRLQSVVIGLVILISAVTLRNIYSDPGYARDNWREALAIIEAQAQTGDVILGRPDHLLPLAYYPTGQVDFTELPAATDDPALQQAFDDEMAIRLTLAGDDKKRAWLITNFYNNNPHGFPQERNRQVEHADDESPQKAWMDGRHTNVGQWSFSGVVLSLYELEQ